MAAIGIRSLGMLFTLPGSHTHPANGTTYYQDREKEIVSYLFSIGLAEGHAIHSAYNLTWCRTAAGDALVQRLHETAQQILSQEEQADGTGSKDA